MHADVLRAQLHGHVAHQRLQRGFDRAHDTVVGHHLTRAQVGHRQHAATSGHVRGAQLGHFGKAVARDAHGAGKTIARAIDHLAMQVCQRCPGDGVNQKINLPKLVHGMGHSRFELAGLFHIAIEQIHAHRVGERLHIFAGLFIQARSNNICPQLTKQLGTAPGNRTVIGDPQDQAFLASQTKKRCSGACHQYSLIR